MDMAVFTAITALFILATVFLGWYGYRNTGDTDDFLLGRKKANSLIIALSYGSAFLSASAIVGFGGQAAKYGMSFIWLVFLNLFLGLLVAFMVFGKRTRRIGRELGAFTFADLLGKRFGSPTIRSLTALIILVGMPIYCAAVLLGGVNFLEAVVGVDRNVALLALTAIVAVYVIYGGVIAVMYNDALQAGIMFVGMAVILVAAYAGLGGVAEANQGLTDLWGAVLAGSGPNAEAAAACMEAALGLQASGMNGWTSFSSFGTETWLTVVTTFMLGVGIGALSQPQLSVRFMTANSDRDLTKSLVIGSIFMIVIVGAAYTVGALTNLYFFNEHELISVAYVGNIDMIMPTFVTELFADSAMGDVFVSMFVLALICASISTISALLHTMGTAGGYDLWTVVERRRGRVGRTEDVRSLRANRIMTLVMITAVVVVAYCMPANIIAKATSVFMGLTAASLLCTYAYGLFCKGKPKLLAAKLSIVAGAASWAVWGFFISSTIAKTLGLCHMLFGVDTLASGLVTFVDPLVVALPISFAALLVGLKWPSGNDAGTAEPAPE